MQLLKCSRCGHSFDFVASSEEVLSFKQCKIKIDLSRALDKIGLDGLSEEVIDSALDELFITVLKRHGRVALWLADAPLDIIFVALNFKVAYLEGTVPFLL